MAGTISRIRSRLLVGSSGHGWVAELGPFEAYGFAIRLVSRRTARKIKVIAIRDRLNHSPGPIQIFLEYRMVGLLRRYVSDGQPRLFTRVEVKRMLASFQRCAIETE